MTRLICMDAPEDMTPKPERLYMYAPNCWSANPFIARMPCKRYDDHWIKSKKGETK